MTRGKRLAGLCMNELVLGAGMSVTVKTFGKVIQRIPFAETLFESSDDTPAAFSIMRPAKSTEDVKSLCPAFGGVAKENLIGWMESVHAEKFNKGLTEHKDPYFYMNKWKKPDHTIAWVKNSDGTFQMISNDTHEVRTPHKKVYLEMVVMRSANQASN